MLFPISAVCHQPDKARRPSAQGMAGIKCRRNLLCRNQSFHNILGIPKEPRKPDADAQPSRGFAGVLSFCGLSNLTKRVQSMPLVWDNALRQFPVSFSASSALHYPQMVLARMLSMTDLAGTSPVDLERPSADRAYAAFFAKNMNYFSVAGCLKSCYANHVFGRREDGTPFMKCCNRFIGIMGAVYTCLGLKSKRAKPSSAWLSYELLFHQIDFLDFFSKATPINRPIAEETRPVRKSKNSGIDITLARRYWLSERVSNP